MNDIGAKVWRLLVDVIVFFLLRALLAIAEGVPSVNNPVLGPVAPVAFLRLIFVVALIWVLAKAYRNAVDVVAYYTHLLVKPPSQGPLVATGGEVEFAESLLSFIYLLVLYAILAKPIDYALSFVPAISWLNMVIGALVLVVAIGALIQIRYKAQLVVGRQQQSAVDQRTTV